MISRMGIAGLVTALILTFGSGILFGHFSQRWGPPSTINEVCDAIERIPTRIADWESIDQKVADEREMRLLRCHGFLNRAYKNQKTNEVVEVYVVLGPSGPISVHQPEICFKSHAYRQRGQRRLEHFKWSSSQESGSGSTNLLWALTFEPTPSNIDGFLTRVYYGWSDGTAWQAPTEARFAFAGRPYLYKLQVSAALPPSADLDERDPCRAFLDDFLKIAGAYLRDGTKTRSDALN